MIKRVFTPEEILDIIAKLKVKYPDYEIYQSHSDPEYIRFQRILYYLKHIGTIVDDVTGKQITKTFEVPVIYTENVHIFECYSM
jgi:hypothetical protein